MSNWQLPTQKGTELFPQATRSPVKVRFEGVPPGSSLARELYGMLQGPIDKFYRGQAQAYSLGVTDQQAGHQTTPEMQLRYQNNQGRETVHVKVAKHVVEAAVKRQSRERWDWALLDFGSIITTSTPGAVEMTARLRLDPDRFQTTSVDTPANSQDALRFPKPGDVIATGTALVTGEWRASLLVDLQPFHGIPEIEVDVWVHPFVYADGPLLGWEAGDWVASPDSSETPLGGYSVHTALGPGAINGSADADVFFIDGGQSTATPDPRTLWPHGAYRSYYIPNDFTAPSNSFWPSTALIAGGVPLSMPSETFIGGMTFVHQTIYQHGPSGLLRRYESHFTRTTITSLSDTDASKLLDDLFAVYVRDINEIHELEPVGMLIDVYGRCFKAGPRWGASTRAMTGWTGQSSTRMWEIESIFPERPPMPLVRSDVPVPAHTDDTPVEGYFVGRAYINIELGSVAFKLADQLEA